MPLLYEPSPRHDCLKNYRFDVTLNQMPENIKTGTLWICPDCGSIFGFFGNTERIHPLVNGPRWETVTLRKAQRIMRNGY